MVVILELHYQKKFIPIALSFVSKQMEILLGEPTFIPFDTTPNNSEQLQAIPKRFVWIVV